MPKPRLNFISHGITCSDMVTTVSENYAREIKTPEFGAGLDDILRLLKKRFKGIINGIDYESYNPEKDAMIKSTYSCSTLKARMANKLFIQKENRLPENINIPLIGIVSRLDEQKGIDLVIESLPSLLTQTKVQIVILGRGKDYYQKRLIKIAKQFNQQLALSDKFDEKMAHSIYAGCDMLLMPSRYEPCGLSQLIAMRYGAVPIVRHTGGLVDKVFNLSHDMSSGNGFIFKEYSVASMLQAIHRAIQCYKLKRAWGKLIKRVMSLDFSWKSPALNYELVYRNLLRLKSNVKM
jgi:starch synthase